jgi:hypothetical protein
MSDYEPLSGLDAERRMRQVAGRLLEAIDEYGKACEAEASATADYEKVYLSEHMRSMLENEKRTTAFHETTAKLVALEQRTAMLAAIGLRRASGEECGSLRQILSSIQSLSRSIRDVT